eukprot:jgi/Psemu1/26402/gm1.26402_g
MDTRDLSPQGYLHNQAQCLVHTKINNLQVSKRSVVRVRRNRRAKQKADISIPRSPLPTILRGPLHYIYYKEQVLPKGKIWLYFKEATQITTTADISILRSPLPTILRGPLHYIYKEQVLPKGKIWLYFKEATQITTTADISILRSPLPPVLHRPLHYIYKETLPKPNDAEKQGEIPPPPTRTPAPLRFVANGLALPSCPKTDGAALMLAVAQKNNGNLTAADAMKQVAFPAEDCKNKSIQRRVLCQKNKMLAEAIPSTVELNQGYHINISSYLDSRIGIWRIALPDKATTTTSNTGSHADSAAIPASSASRADSTSTRCVGSKRGYVAVAMVPFINKKKPHQNGTQLNYMHAAREEQNERYLKGVAAGIKMYRDHQSGKCMVHKLVEDMANCVSRPHGTSITIGTIRYRVWKQNTHQHDLVEPSAGRPSRLPPTVEKALVTAMETYSNLMSAEMKEKPNPLGQIKRLESCLKDSPSTLKDSCVALYKHLSAKYAVELEERRCVWTTSNNINTWFETVKEILVDYGFAHLATEEEIRNGQEGELVFYPGQLNRILNVDKTALTLDGTSTNAGSRPVTEYGRQIEFYHGDALGRRRALKSSATEENKRISKSFIDELDKSGTLNCNQAAGMDSVEFCKYFETSIMPLFPDAQPAKGKYVYFIVDSSPGWSDPELHRLMSTKGFLLIAGVPNTTHVTQVTDVSFNPFKTAFHCNKKKLHTYQRSKKQIVKTGDIPALVFGYKESLNRACWAKIGIALFTRKCLGDRNVAHELMTLANGMINVDTDPKTVALLELQRRNRIAVQTLVDHGFNGGVYAKNAPRPRYKVLQGRAYNCKDQHIVYERIWREGDINAMKETKTKALAYTKNEEAAEPIMEQCNGNFMDLPVLQLRKVFVEWKLQEKSAKLNKDDMVVGALMEAKDDPPVSALEWTEVDEAELKRLIEEDIKIKHTELGKAMAKDLIQLVSMVTIITTEERMEIAHEYLSEIDCEKLQVMSNTWHCES